MIDKNTSAKSFWSLSVDEVLKILDTSLAGLSEAEARFRLKVFGENKLPEKKRAIKLKLFLSQFSNPLIFLLLIASAITFFLENFKDAIFILFAVFANSLLGFYQENKAEEALGHLKTYVKERVRVFRDNREFEIESSNLAPGDVAHLSQGDRVPADCRIIYDNDLLADESILTGESLPVHKNKNAADSKAVLGDQSSMLFSGTAIVQGFANAVVVRTGLETEIGKIALLVQESRREKTPLQNAIARFSVQVGVVLTVLTVIVFFAAVFSGKSILEMFLISVAIVVSAVPEGLPVALTVVLAIGVRRMAKKNGIVRKLLAAETLGSATVILTDKTGTLTQAKMNLSKIIPASGVAEDFILKFVVLNSDVVIENPSADYKDWRIIGRPLEVAAVRGAAGKGVLLPLVKQKVQIEDYLPFNSANKFSASVVRVDGESFLNFFGAPEILLNFCDTLPQEKERILIEVEKMAYGGERVLGVVAKKLARTISLKNKKDFQQSRFLGIVSFRDPPRPEVKDAIKKIADAKVKTIIVTGDHRGTAESVARETGLEFTGEQVLGGAEIDFYSSGQLKERLSNARIIFRVSPEGKFRIAKAFQEMDEVVAMTGDGVNDAPSLKQADIGVSMGSGSDVAKDVSDLILLDDNFETIVEAILEGRRILSNIKKVIVYTLSNALDAIILIGGSLLAGLSLPLSPLQILWVNFFTDSFPAVALAFEDGIDHSKEKPFKLTKNLFDPTMRFLVLVIGVISSVILLVLYAGMLRLGFDEPLAKTVVFFTFGTYTLFLIFAVRSLKRSIFTLNPLSNGYLLLSVVFGLVLMIAAVYAPFFQKLFGTVSLPLNFLWIILAVGVLNILLIELGKWIYRKN